MPVDERSSSSPWYLVCHPRLDPRRGSRSSRRLQGGSATTPNGVVMRESHALSPPLGALLLRRPVLMRLVPLGRQPRQTRAPRNKAVRESSPDTGVANGWHEEAPVDLGCVAAGALIRRVRAGSWVPRPAWRARMSPSQPPSALGRLGSFRRAVLPDQVGSDRRAGEIDVGELVARHLRQQAVRMTPRPLGETPHRPVLRPYASAQPRGATHTTGTACTRLLAKPPRFHG